MAVLHRFYCTILEIITYDPSIYIMDFQIKLSQYISLLKLTYFESPTIKCVNSSVSLTVKDKAEVLMQVDQLTEVKDELTEQVKLRPSLKKIVCSHRPFI